MYVEKYKVSGLKLYTFDSTKKKGWWFDDEKLAYPMWEECRKLGIKNIGCHKGIPFGQFYARYAHAEDFDAAADDFLDLNFIAYHSAWPYHDELAALKGFKPQRKNLYCEVGSTFAATVTSRPLECAHVLGTLLRDLGPDYVLWGTDSLLWGNPQWQIDAFRKFQIPDQLVEGYGYPKLTPEIKRKVFGENAARIWNLKTTARRPSRRGERSPSEPAGGRHKRRPPARDGGAMPIYEYECAPCQVIYEVRQEPAATHRSTTARAVGGGVTPPDLGAESQP